MFVIFCEVIIISLLLLLFFTDCPVEASLRKSDVLRKVVSVEGESSLKTKRVASAKASKSDVRECRHLADEVRSVADGHADLKAVFAGVAAAGDHNAVDAAEGGGHAGHELEAADARGVLRLHEGSEGALGLGPLNSNKSVCVVEGLELEAGELDQMGCKVLHVLLVARAVDDKVDVVLETAHNSVVDGPAPCIGDDRVLDGLVGRVLDVYNSHLLDELLAVGAVDAHLTHVRNVEDRSALAAEFNFLLHAEPVVEHGHFPPEKVDELGALLLVELVEGGAAQRAAAVRRSAGCGKHLFL